MTAFYRPTSQELMEQARAALQGRLGQGAHAKMPADRIAQLRDLIGPAPIDFLKPAYGTPGYALAQALGWISEEQVASDLAVHEERRLRALQTCHRPGSYERPRFDPARESGAYVPELSARLEDDRNLTDGARRCARKLAEEIYRRNREGRSIEITVTYLMKALGKCRRTVQRYLRMLEGGGYIRADVIVGNRSRLCIGLAVQLCEPLFAHHHRKRWPARADRGSESRPENPGDPGASKLSQNYRLRNLDTKRSGTISRESWTLKCMDGVYRALMKTTIPLTTSA